MATDEAPFLTKGVEVSAKYKGAYCEAKVKHVEKLVKCKVLLKESGKILIVSDEDLRGTLKVGETVSVRGPDTGGVYVEAVLNRVHDQSMYTVVFNDGDENRLKRTKLCPKGARHFMKSETLDDLPLTHPERFGTPVVKNSKAKVAAAAAVSAIGAADSESDMDSSDGQSDSGGGGRTKQVGSGGGYTSQQNLMGSVVCVDLDEKNRKSVTIPALVVLPSADDQLSLPSKQHVCLKSFRDSKFFTSSASKVQNFESVVVGKKTDKVIKGAFDRAKQYVEKGELPPSWDRNELLGFSSDESGQSDDEVLERDDCFVAQLYKFMDDRGTPINKAPTVTGKDVSLSKLFRLVHDLGGYNKVTNHLKWHIVCRKLLLSRNSAQSTLVKSLYKKYLHAFEDFNRKLGCTMESINRSDRRQASFRSLVSFRERERGERDRSPKSIPGGATAGKGSRDDESFKSSSVERMSRLVVKSDSDIVKSESIVQLAASKSDISKSDQGKALQIKSSSKRDPDDTKMSIIAAAACKTDIDISSRKLGDAADRGIKVKDTEAGGTASGRMTRAEAVKTSVRREDKRRGPVGKTEETGGWGGGESGIESEREERAGGVVHKRSRRIASSAVADDGGGDVVRDDDRGDPDTVSTTHKTDSDARPRRKSLSDDSIVVGCKLNVKYGKGKHQKIYEAKVLDVQDKGGSMRYMVHYSGWNSRYDEWVRRDVIDSVVEEPSTDVSKTTKLISIQPKSAAHRRKLSRSNDSARGALKDVGEETPQAKPKVSKTATEAVGASSISAAKNTRMPIVDISKSGIKSPGRIQRRTRTRSTARDTGAESDDESSDDDDDDNDSSDDDDGESSKSSPVSKPRSPAVAAGSPAASTVKPVPLSKRKDTTRDSVASADDSESESEAGSSIVKAVGGPRWRTRKNSERLGAGDAPISMVNASKLQPEADEVEACEEVAEENKRESLGAPDLTLPESQMEGSGDEKLTAGEKRMRSDSVSSEKQMERMPDLIPAMEEQPLTSSAGDSDEGNSQGGVSDREGKTVAGGRKEEVEEVWSSKVEESEPVVLRKRAGGRSLAARQVAEKNRSSEDSSKRYATPSKRKKPVESDSVSPERKLAKPSKEMTASDVMKSIDPVMELSGKQDGSEADSETESERKTAGKSKKQQQADVSGSNIEKSSRGDDVKEDVDVKLSQIDTFAFNDDDEDGIPELHPHKSAKTKTSAATDSLLALEESMEQEEEEIKEERIYEPISEAEERYDDDDDNKLEERIEEVEEFEEEYGEEEERVEEMPLSGLEEGTDQQGLTMALFDACAAAETEDQRRAEAAETLLMSHRQPQINEALHAKMVSSSSYHDSPPDSSVDHSPSSSAELGEEDGGLVEPVRERANIGAECGTSDERNSTKSEREANLEVEAYMRRESRLRESCGAGVDCSPSGFEFSAASNDDSSAGGSSRSAGGRRNQSDKRGSGREYAQGVSSQTKSKRSSMIEEEEDDDDDDDDDEEKPVRKRVRRKKSGDKNLSTSVYKSTELSDSDDGLSHNDSLVTPARSKMSSASVSKPSASSSSRLNTHKLSRSNGTTSGSTGKYNFLDLEEGKYLEGDERIDYLSKKIQDLRTVYMSLKAEVACIDRRRKRHRGREHRSDQASCNTSSLLVTSAAGSAQSLGTPFGVGSSGNPSSAPVTL